MDNHRIPCYARYSALFLLSSLALSARADDDFLKSISLSGRIDYYYQYDFNKPGTGPTVSYRQFDVNHNEFGLAVLELDAVRKPTDKDPFGFTVNLTVGKNADIMNAFEPGGQNTYKLLQQAYITYTPAKSPITLDFGKFFTWIGYEGMTSWDQDNYSRSLLCTLAQPIYHMGLRATAPINKVFTGGLYFVNGWNEVEDSNGGKSYGASLSYTPTSTTTITANYYGGNEGSDQVNGFFGLPVGVSSVHLGDLVVIEQLTPKIKLGLNADYASVKGSDSVAPGGTFSGIAGYVKAQLSTKLSGTLRYESFIDPSGLRTGISGFHDSEGTVTLDYSTAANSLLRLEVRYDKLNSDQFVSDSGLKDNQTTVSISHVLKF